MTPIIRNFVKKFFVYSPILVCLLVPDFSNKLLAQKLSAGSQHSIMLCANGSVKVWGDNSSYQLANNIINQSNVPIVVNGITGTITAVSAGAEHNLVLQSDGTVWSWGLNSDGQLGDGTTNPSSVPTKIPGLSGVIAISAGAHHSLVLKNDGTVWGWGANYDGQLGNGTLASSLVPVKTSKLSNVIAISAGSNHNMALKSDSTLWTWGYNYSGQLGLGSTTDSLSPCKIPGLSKIIGMDAGDDYSLAIKNNGTVLAWGDNNNGKLGDGTTTPSLVPVAVNVLTNVIAVSAGYSHSMALKSDSTVWKWGADLPIPQRKSHGVPIVLNFLPEQVSGLSGIFAISAGSLFEIAYKNNQTVWAWGNNGYAQLGTGNNFDSSIPQQTNCVCSLLSPTISVSANVTICPGFNTTLSGVVSGGNGLPFSYSWSPSRTIMCATCANAVVNPATKETYTLTGFDKFMCSSKDSVKISTLPAPQTPSISVSPFPTLCNGNNVSLTAGNTSISYYWLPGGSTATTIAVNPTQSTTYSLVTTGPNGCTTSDSVAIQYVSAGIDKYDMTCGSCNGQIYANPFGGASPYTYQWNNQSTNSFLTSLCKGNYSLTVIDANGCATTTTVTINDSGPLTLAPLTKKDISCKGAMDGTITATPSGGTQPYYYDWGNTLLQYTQTITGLMAKGYTLTLTDAAGCSNLSKAGSVHPFTSGTVVDSIKIIEPALLTGSIVKITPLTCNGGNDGDASLMVNGGTIPYSYLWTPTGQTTKDATGLAAISYTVSITDKNKCTSSTTTSISQPSPIQANFATTTVTCNGGSNGTLMTTPTGGTPIYKFLWSTGSSEQAINNQPASNYSLTITDANSCTKTFTASITQPTAITTVLAYKIEPSCFGESNGTLCAAASGGTGTKTYLWNTIPVQTTAKAVGLSANTYTVTVTDKSGCTKSTAYTMTEPTLLTASVSSTNTSCNNTCTGSATAFPSGGTIPYTYFWLPSMQNTQTASGLCLGSHTVTVIDKNGCSTTNTVVVDGPLPIPITTSTTPTSCGTKIGTAVVSVLGQGAVPPLKYLWSNGQSSTSVSGLAAGIYRVNVTDGNGCFSFADALISNSNGTVININNTMDVSCFGFSNGSINVSATGGTQPYKYAWSNGATTQNISGLDFGPYEIKVSDATGCIAIKNIFINQPAPLALIPSEIKSSCGKFNGSAFIAVNGGTFPYSYAWSTGATTSAATPLAAGIYSLTVTDKKGCTETLFTAVQDSGGPEVLIDTIAAANCGSKGFVLINPINPGEIDNYLWNIGGTTQNLTNASVGNYGLVVTDTSGCKTVLIAPVTPALPQLKPICIVTVDTITKNNMIVWEKPVSNIVSGFNIYRESSLNGVYQLIGFSPYNSVSTYYDITTNPSNRWAKYKISMVDICGTEGPISPDHKTIHLSITSATKDSTNLIWDVYEGFPFSQYNIFRKDSSSGIWNKIGFVPSTINTYVDKNLPAKGDSLFYHIDVAHGGGDCMATIKYPEPMATSVKSGKSNSSERTGGSGILSSTSNILKDAGVSIYPNPNSGIFTISSDKDAITSIRIFNTLGELVYTKNVNSKKSEIVIPEIAKGIYQLQLIFEKNTMNKKIMIQ